MTLILWILKVIPLAVFAISMPVATKTGMVVAGSLGIYLLTISALLLLVTIAFYPLGVLLGAGLQDLLLVVLGHL